MMQACKTFLKDRLSELLLADGETAPYAGDCVFFGDMPRDFLKDNAYAVNCLIFKDAKQKDGSMIAAAPDDDRIYSIRTRRIYRRTVMFRCMMYAGFEELWGGAEFVGLMDQFEAKVAEHRAIADSGNNCINIKLNDAGRPFNDEVKQQQIRRRPSLGIIRVEFDGGIHRVTSVPIIPSIEIEPSYQVEEA